MLLTANWDTGRKKKWVSPTLVVSPLLSAGESLLLKDTKELRFRITNLADVAFSVEDIYVQLITCGGEAFILSVGKGLGSERIDLGTIDFEGSSVKKLSDEIFEVQPLSTAFFRVGYNAKAVYDEVERQRSTPCKVKASKDTLKEVPAAGDVYLLMRIVRPDNGLDYPIRRKIDLVAASER